MEVVPKEKEKVTGVDAQGACTSVHERSKRSHILWSLYSSITVRENTYLQCRRMTTERPRQRMAPAKQAGSQRLVQARARPCARTEPVIQPANNPSLQDVLLFSANPSRRTQRGFRAPACGLRRRQRSTDQYERMVD